ncbi:MAG TPA: hypothetical protein VIY56_19530 [Vicinamibacterales bacterium]
MTLRDLFRTPTSRAVAELRGDVQRLTAVVERLEAAQRKEGKEVERLRDTSTAHAQAAKQQFTATEKALVSVNASIQLHAQRAAEVARSLERLEAARDKEPKWRKIFSNQVATLIRHVCLPLDQLPPPYALMARRFRLTAQNEEDGVLLGLLGFTGWGQSRFVEIGSGKSGGNAAVLAQECGWSGLMIELSESSVRSARQRFAGNRGVTVVSARVMPENVNALMEQHGFAGEVDVFSIDIDSYDYWVLDALTASSPRILILEYNALFGPDRRVTIPLGQSLDGVPKGYQGASLSALTDLAVKKGYRLVACEPAGVNAFFVRNDIAPTLPGITAAEAYRPLRSHMRQDSDDDEIKTDVYAAAEKLQLPLVEV